MILSKKTIGKCNVVCMCSLVEILCVLEEEIGLVYWQLPYTMHVMETFDIQPTCELSFIFFQTE